ncbi:hypothetical protein ABPG72_003812 [Tetrahymena utriculariae]
MAKRRIYILLPLFVLNIFIQIEAQSIKIPLKFKYKKLVLSATFGQNQCQIDAEIQFNLCTSIISDLKDNKSINNCGSESTGEIDQLTGDQIYVAPLNLNGFKTSLSFNIPKSNQTFNYGTKSLCFGFGSYQLQSVLRNMFIQGQIKQPIAYLYLDNVLQKEKTGDVTGFIELGELYQPQFQKRDCLKYLKSGQTFDLSTNQSHFNFNSPYYSLSSETNPQKESSDKSMYIVPYIDQLDDIEVIFTEESTEYSYTISISPEIFCRRIENDDYELLFEAIDSGIDFRFGNTIFQSYYVGFNQFANKIQVAKRAKQPAFVLFLIFLSILSLQFQTLTISLKSKDSSLIIETTYGANHCQIEAVAVFTKCSTIISIEQKDEQNLPESCGSFQTGSTALGIPIFISLFQMSNVQSYIHFQIPDEKQYLDFGKKELCFGYNSFDFANSAIRDLYDFGLINQPVAFLTLNQVLQVQNTNKIVGQIDLGQPNNLLIKDGEQLTILKAVNKKNFYYYAVFSMQSIQFLGQAVKLPTENISFNFNSPYYAISSETYFYIIKQLKDNNIDYLIQNRQKRDKDVQDSNMISVSDITKLSDIQVELIKEDNTLLKINIKPSQYTRKLDSNKYEMLFDTYLGIIDFSLGNTIFETYYLGFNQANGKVLIAERSTQNISASLFD